MQAEKALLALKELRTWEARKATLVRTSKKKNREAYSDQLEWMNQQIQYYSRLVRDMRKELFPVGDATLLAALGR